MPTDTIEHVVTEADGVGPVHCWRKEVHSPDGRYLLGSWYASASRIGLVVETPGGDEVWCDEDAIGVHLEQPNSFLCEAAATHLRLRSAYEKGRAA